MLYLKYNLGKFKLSIAICNDLIEFIHVLVYFIY